MQESIYAIKVKNIAGQESDLSPFKGKVLLIVNTASKCGFTPQYKGLEEVFKKFKDKGLMVLGFPCNQFGHQEPDGEDKIQEFCELNFGVSFPLYSKIDVNGKEAHPLFEYLKKSLPGILGSEAIKWNFTKFLVDKNGRPFKRYAPNFDPKEMVGDIEGLLSN